MKNVFRRFLIVCWVLPPPLFLLGFFTNENAYGEYDYTTLVFAAVFAALTYLAQFIFLGIWNPMMLLKPIEVPLAANSADKSKV